MQPHEVYNLAAMSFVPASWDQPMLTGEYNAQGVTRVLEAIRHVDTSIKLYQASSGATSYTARPIAPRSCSPRRQPRRPLASDATRNTSSMAVTDLSGVSGSA